MPEKSLGLIRSVAARVVTIRFPNNVNRIGLQLLLPLICGGITIGVWLLPDPAVLWVCIGITAFSTVPLFIEAWSLMRERHADLHDERESE
jgi:hypothetical protein